MSDPNYRALLVAFYTKHAPEKVSAVDATLAKYVGKEKELFEALAAKYNATAEEMEFWAPPQAPSWIKILCEKQGFNDEIVKSIKQSLEENGIGQDVFYSLTEPHCNALLNTPLIIRMHVWEIVKKETGRSNEVEKLREENLKLKNEIDQLKAELQSKQ